MGLYTSVIKILVYYIVIVMLTFIFMPNWALLLLTPITYVVVLPLQLMVNLVIKFIFWLDSIPLFSDYIDTSSLQYVDLLAYLQKNTAYWSSQLSSFVPLPDLIKIPIYFLIVAVFSWIYFNTIGKLLS